MSDYMTESTFWYFIARLTDQDVREQISESLRFMNERAGDEGLPVRWEREKAVPWATACRLYVLSKQKIESRAAFNAFRKGSSSIFNPRDFLNQAIGRLSDNINAPAIRGRSAADSVADTFAVASMNYTISAAQADNVHREVLESLVLDDGIHSAAMLAAAPESSEWPSWVSIYEQRRPSWLRRMFSNAETWLFPKDTTKIDVVRSREP